MFPLWWRPCWQSYGFLVDCVIVQVSTALTSDESGLKAAFSSLHLFFLVFFVCFFLRILFISGVSGNPCLRSVPVFQGLLKSEAEWFFFSSASFICCHACIFFFVNILWMQRASNRQRKLSQHFVFWFNKSILTFLPQFFQTMSRFFFLFWFRWPLRVAWNIFLLLKAKYLLQSQSKMFFFFWHVCEFISNFGLQTFKHSIRSSKS